MSELLTLREAQQRMKDHAYHVPFCALWADMGAGKTATILSLVRDLIDWCDVSRVLVVATKRVAKNTWPKEILRWKGFEDITCRVLEAPDFKFKRQEVTIKKRKKGKIHTEIVKRNVPQSTPAAFLTGEVIHTIHRDLLAPLMAVLKVSDWPYDIVILDESSGFRDQDSKRFKSVRALRKHKSIGRLIQLSGTPAPNGLEGLWAQVYLLDEGKRLGKTLTEYRERYFEPDKRSRDQVFSWKPKPGAREKIFEAISDICISVLPQDCGVELPARDFVQIPVTLDASARKLYRDMERHYLALTDEGDIVASNSAVRVGKLLQMAGGAAYDENGNVQPIHDAKIEALGELVESMQGRPLLVAYWFQHERDRILKAFPGSVELDDDPETEDRWNRGEIDMMLIHPASGAHGLNLQFNDGHCVWFSPIHDLELYLQLNKRLHRPGRKYPVVIYHLIAEDTIDGAVLDSLDPKNVGQNLLLEAVRIRKGQMGEEV
jgi:hypothetical protein